LTLQSKWRIAGACTLAGAGLMAWYGVHARLFSGPRLFLVLYWGAFVLLLAATFYTVLLDVRYIKLQYSLEKRELFRETLGDETFRKALIEGQKRQEDQDSQA